MSCTKLIVTAGGLPSSERMRSMQISGLGQGCSQGQPKKPCKIWKPAIRMRFQRTRLRVNNPSAAVLHPEEEHHLTSQSSVLNSGTFGTFGTLQIFLHYLPALWRTCPFALVAA
ncbi:uncharacterized protein LOC127011071 [Drosophila biarmipes]|uniref:uncharacterized protein LOC127011071 n=1 Tax=Drosophila biarmipes TaxID=125945 RepID=UPI0021CC7915|nr:uncharacterized protein LOC127011071 [Drosophila biarmipes]